MFLQSSRQMISKLILIWQRTGISVRTSMKQQLQRKMMMKKSLPKEQGNLNILMMNSIMKV